MEQLRLFASLLCGALLVLFAALTPLANQDSALLLKTSLRAIHIRNGPDGAVLGNGSFIRGRVSLLLTKHYLLVNLPSSGVPLRLLCCFLL